MADSNTIGGPGAPVNITFTQFGSSYAANYSDSLAAGVNAVLSGGGTVTTVSAGSSSAFFPEVPAGQTAIYSLVPTTVQGTTSQDFTIATAGYVLDTIGGSVIITDAAAGDSILVSADNPATTVNTFGGDNLVVFIDGNNVFNGDSVSANTLGGDTVVGGTGNDTINTGYGSTTVNSGTGYDIITLNDTGSSTTYNDAVFLDTGFAKVVADGSGDYVVATTEGQTIEGGAAETSADNLTVVLLPNSDGTISGDDSVTGAAGYLTVGDESSDNTITGGTGGLTFIGAVGITADINIGSGYGLLFGNSGDSITLGAVTGDTGGAAVFVAGLGNETLNAAASTANVTIFGGSDSTGTDVLTAGSGTDLLVAGLGTETLTGGAGTDTFLIDSVGAAGASLTIGDFVGNDVLALNYSASDISSALAGGAVDSDGNFVITFADTSTTVTFTGITSASELTGHIITF